MAVELKKRLEVLRDDLAVEIARDRATLAVEPEDRGEDITPSQHPADVASDLFVRESLLTSERMLEEGAFAVGTPCGASARGRTVSARTAVTPSRRSGSRSFRRPPGAWIASAARSASTRRSDLAK